MEPPVTDIAMRFDRMTADGASQAVMRAVAVETPVALEFNGVGYAVLMASPGDLGDLLTGFALAERLIDAPQDIIGHDVHDSGHGLLIRAQLVEERSERLLTRVRHRVSDSSCGLCGIENLEQAMRPLPVVSGVTRADRDAIFRALDLLADAQPGHDRTGAMHAAALCSADGQPLLVREDVGRHNAFDKLIGAMRRAGMDWDGGFALLSSRCSYELVEKAALANCPLLVTLSAPTSLALARAEAAGLRLFALARKDAFIVPAKS